MWSSLNHTSRWTHYIKEKENKKFGFHPATSHQLMCC
jgi:hypothetical protein